MTSEEAISKVGDGETEAGRPETTEQRRAMRLAIASTMLFMVGADC